MQMVDIQALMYARRIKWTAHVMERLQERGIHPSDIRSCLSAGEIIEEYPDDYPYPRCLILGYTQAGTPLHVVVSIGMGLIWVITAYVPSGEKWKDDLRIRRQEDE